MSTASTVRILCALVLACFAQRAAAQCPDGGSALTPTIRALLMLERPAALTEEQWAKVIENPDNRMVMEIKIYEEETVDKCELPPRDWYILMPGRRPPEEHPRLFSQKKPAP